MMERGAPVAREMADARCWALMGLSVRKHLKNTQKKKKKEKKKSEQSARCSLLPLVGKLRVGTAAMWVL